MRRVKNWLFLLLLIAYKSSAAQTSDNNITAQYVINKFIDAMGGKDALLSVKSRYTEMSTEIDGRQVCWIVKEMAPNKGSFQIIYNNRMVYDRWFNGTKGYVKDGNGKKDAEPYIFEDKIYKKNIWDELDYLDTTLYKLELLGSEAIADEDCYKIKSTLIGLNKETTHYYSKSTFDLVMEEKLAGNPATHYRTMYYGYQKSASGLGFSEMKIFHNGETQTVTITKTIANELITNKDFIR